MSASPRTWPAQAHLAAGDHQWIDVDVEKAKHGHTTGRLALSYEHDATGATSPNGIDQPGDVDLVDAAPDDSSVGVSPESMTVLLPSPDGKSGC